MFGCIFLLLLGLVTFGVLRQSWLIAVGAANMIMGALVLSPWFYVVLRFGRALLLTDPVYMKDRFTKAGFFPDSIDNLWSRLSPLPLDLRFDYQGN